MMVKFEESCVSPVSKILEIKAVLQMRYFNPRAEGLEHTKFYRETLYTKLEVAL